MYTVVRGAVVRRRSYSPGVADTDMIRILGKEGYSEKVTEGVTDNTNIDMTGGIGTGRMVEILTEDK